MSPLTPTATAPDLRRKNREVYDDTSGLIWRTVVYDALHGGWEFINLGGRPLLDRIGGLVPLGPGTTAVELCCGRAATCLYLAERFGCQVTGVEINRRQIARARSRLRKAPPEVGGRVRVVESDVLDWRPERLHHAAVSVDSLMLIANPRLFLEVARDCLLPAGWLLFATITAGPRIDERFRQFAWEVDGMVNLPDPSFYSALLSELGFGDIAIDDLTPLAIESSLTMVEALEGSEDEIVQSCGRSDYDGWLAVGRIYLKAFQEGMLRYSFIHCQLHRQPDAGQP